MTASTALRSGAVTAPITPPPPVEPRRARVPVVRRAVLRPVLLLLRELAARPLVLLRRPPRAAAAVRPAAPVVRRPRVDAAPLVLRDDVELRRVVLRPVVLRLAVLRPVVLRLAVLRPVVLLRRPPRAAAAVRPAAPVVRRPRVDAVRLVPVLRVDVLRDDAARRVPAELALLLRAVTSFCSFSFALRSFFSSATMLRTDASAVVSPPLARRVVVVRRALVEVLRDALRDEVPAVRRVDDARPVPLALRAMSDSLHHRLLRTYPTNTSFVMLSIPQYVPLCVHFRAIPSAFAGPGRRRVGTAAALSDVARRRCASPHRAATPR